MKKLFAAVLGSLAFAGQAGAVVINFDSYANGTELNVGTFDPLGIRFNENLVVSNGGAGDLPSSPPNAAINNDNYGGDITGYFFGPVASVDFISVFAGDNGGDTDTVTLRGYDALNNLLASSTFTGTVAQTLSIAGAGIVRFELIQAGLIGFDDFTFEPTRTAPTKVSEPATLALLGLGLLAFGVARRRTNM